MCKWQSLKEFDRVFKGLVLPKSELWIMHYILFILFYKDNMDDNKISKPSY